MFAWTGLKVHHASRSAALWTVLGAFVALVAGGNNALAQSCGWVTYPGAHAGRRDGQMAFDPQSQRLVHVGGFPPGGGGTADWMLARTGTEWVSNIGNTPRRRGAGLVAVDGRLVYVGGVWDTTDFMAPWTAFWSGGQWTSYLPSPNPGRRAYFGLSARPSVGGAYLFGGHMPGVAASGELWVFVGPDFFNPTGGWGLLSTSGPARRAHGQAWDDARGQLVVFGGRSLSNQLLDDTWVWSDGTQSWNRIASSVGPSARERPAMGYDPLRRVVVLFGGMDANGGTLNDTWEFDGERWQMVSAGGGGSPQGRAGASICWEPVRQCLVIFGGHSDATGNVVLNDTLEYRGFRSAYITRQPQDVRVCQGQLVELSVDFFAPWSTQVQWIVTYPSGMQMTLPLEGPVVSFASSMFPTGSQVFARIAGGTSCSIVQESRRATIRVDEMVTSTSLVISAGINCVGSSITLRANFGSPLVPGPFRWSRNSEPIATTIEPVLTISDLIFADTGNYECRRDTICFPNAVASTCVFVNSPPGPYAVSSPQSAYVGQSIELIAVPIGVPGSFHQWQARSSSGVHWTNLYSGEQEVAGVRFDVAPSGRNAIVNVLSLVPSRSEVEFRVVASQGCFSSISQSQTVTFRRACSPADIADDQGNPLPAAPGATNNGVNEGDYNAFFSADGFFNQAALGPAAVGMFCDIADDQGTAFPPFGTGGSGGASNTGVNEGDYNCFFNNLFIPCP